MHACVCCMQGVWDPTPPLIDIGQCAAITRGDIKVMDHDVVDRQARSFLSSAAFGDPACLSVM